MARRTPLPASDSRRLAELALMHLAQDERVEPWLRCQARRLARVLSGEFYIKGFYLVRD